MVILRQCSRESFYERCLPLSGIFGLLTYYAVRTGWVFNLKIWYSNCSIITIDKFWILGYWQPSKRFGALPKIALAVGLAFYAGKLSYRDECMEKFMQSSNSKVGEFLREKFNRSPPKYAYIYHKIVTKFNTSIRFIDPSNLILQLIKTMHKTFLEKLTLRRIHKWMRLEILATIWIFNRFCNLQLRKCLPNVIIFFKCGFVFVGFW